jgi:hypothetical protein
VRKPLGKSPFGRVGMRWEGEIQVYLREVSSEDGMWMALVQDSI